MNIKSISLICLVFVSCSRQNSIEKLSRQYETCIPCQGLPKKEDKTDLAKQFSKSKKCKTEETTYYLFSLDVYIAEAVLLPESQEDSIKFQFVNNKQYHLEVPEKYKDLIINSFPKGFQIVESGCKEDFKLWEYSVENAFKKYPVRRTSTKKI